MSEFFTKSAPDPHHWTLNSCFGAFLFLLGAFGTVSLLHKNCCKTRQTDAINAKVPATMSCKIFLTTNALDPLHWTLNSCFGAFLSVWVHLGPFRYCTKTRQTGAINAKVRATKSCRNFSQRRSRSTPLDPKLMFYCVSFRSGAFGNVSLLHKNATSWCN